MSEDNLIAIPERWKAHHVEVIEGQVISLELVFGERRGHRRCLGGSIITGDVRVRITSTHALNIAERARAAIDSVIIGSGYAPDWSLQ